MSRTSPEIIYLEDSQDLREVVALHLELNLRMSCATFSCFEEMKTQQSAVLQSKVAILDIQLAPNEPNGIDVYRWLLGLGYAGKIFFLTGHGNLHPLVKEAIGLKAAILEKPISAELLIGAIKPYLIPETTQTASNVS